MQKEDLNSLYEKVKSIQKYASLKNFEKTLDFANELAGELQYLIKNSDSNHDNNYKATRNRIDNKKDVAFVAYYVSRFEHEDLFQLPQKYAYEKISELLGVKASTFRNLRDIFDNHIKEIKQKESPSLSIRNGWDSDLKGLNLEIFNMCNKKSKAELLLQVKNILDI